MRAHLPQRFEVWMLRLSPLLLVLAATAATAQEAPAQPATTAPSSPAPAAATATATATATTNTPKVNPRLAPGGVATGTSSFPLHLQATLDTSLGNGVFAPGYQIQPSLGSSLNLRPSASLPKIDGLPKAILTGSIDFSVSNWIPASQTSGVYDRQVRVGDPSVAVILPGIFKEEFTGIGVSLVGSARLPLSITSRQQNLITNVGGSAQFAWGSPDLAIGSFFAQYSPSVRASIYSQLGATMPCDAPNLAGTPRPLGDPINGLDTLPTYIAPRDEQYLPDGTCVLAGRQSIAAVSNSVATGWTDPSGNHNLSLSLGISHSFSRGLKSDPTLSSPFSSGQNFNESTNGSLSYAYTLPFDFNSSISTGIFSGQPSVSGTGLRFPFWDFQTPANNFSGFFFDLTVGI